MDYKKCMNEMCGTTTAATWKKGWALPSGELSDLCFSCGTAYENSTYCETFHLKEEGWRHCKFCEKRIHCGCIASAGHRDLLIGGGVKCTNCGPNSRNNVTTRSAVRSDIFRPPVTNTTNDQPSPEVENDITTKASYDVSRLTQLRDMLQTNAPDIVPPPTRVEPMPVVELGSGCSSNAASHLGSMLGDSEERFTQPLSITPGAIPENPMSGLILNPGLPDQIEPNNAPSPFQPGQQTRPVIPNGPQVGVGLGSELNNGSSSSMRLEIPQLDSSVGQLVRLEIPQLDSSVGQLVRYEPNIEQIATDLNSTMEHLFDKILTPSDVGRIGRLVIPKVYAELYFPPIQYSEGVPVTVQDITGKMWSFQFRFWPNNNSRMYVLEGVTPCLHSLGIQAGDTVTFSRINPIGQLVMGYRKAIESTHEQESEEFGPRDGNPAGGTSNSGGVGSNRLGSTVENSTNQPNSKSDKKRTRNVGQKNKRLSIQTEDSTELRLSWEKAQDMLCPPPNVKPNTKSIDGIEFEGYVKPPVYGKPTVLALMPSGVQDKWGQCDVCAKWRRLTRFFTLPPQWTCTDNVCDPSRNSCSVPEEMSKEDLAKLVIGGDLKQKKRVIRYSNDVCKENEEYNNNNNKSYGETTRHPRHRLGCPCIVCCQPRSGAEKHPKWCMCNACASLKRRSLTILLKKQRKAAKEEAEKSNKVNPMTDSETNDTTNSLAMQIENLSNQIEAHRLAITQPVIEQPNNSNSHIDLNSDPDRDISYPGMSMMSLLQATTLPFDSYMCSGELANFLGDPNDDIGSYSQDNGQTEKRGPEDGFLG